MASGFPASPSPLNADHNRRMISRAEAAKYCGVSLQTFSRWVHAGIMPKALPGTARWDRRALDQRIDILSGVTASEQSSPLDTWRANRARRSEGNS